MLGSSLFLWAKSLVLKRGKKKKALGNIYFEVLIVQVYNHKHYEFFFRKTSIMNLLPLLI